MSKNKQFMKSSLFWNTTQRWYLVHWKSITSHTIPYITRHLMFPALFSDCLTLEPGPIGCNRSLFTNQRPLLSHKSEGFFYSAAEDFNHESPIFFFFRWRYSPQWALACWTITLHFFLSITNSMFSLPTLEDLFLFLSILSWVFLFVSSLPVLEWRVFVHPMLLHSLQVTQPTYLLPIYLFYYIFSFIQLFSFSICPNFPFPIFIFMTIYSSKYFPFKNNKALYKYIKEGDAQNI